MGVGDESVIEVVRILFACVFAVAGMAKLADREGSRRAMVGFGVPGRLVAPLAIFVPLAEIAIAVALLPGASARAAAVGAAALMTLFAIAVGVALARGRKPDCGCFGRLHSKPAGWGTVARNVALAAVAALIVVAGPAADPSWVEAVVAGVILFVSAQAILLVVLLRRYGRALRRIEELEARPVPPALSVGMRAPHFKGLEELLAPRRPVLLVFSEADCPACRLLEPQLEAWKREHADRLTISVVYGEVLALYGGDATPSAVLVGPNGRVAHALVTGTAEIEELVGTAAPRSEPAVNGRPPIAAAAALAGGLAVTAAAHAGGSSNTTHDPELQAIDTAFKAGLQRLTPVSDRSSKAVRAYARTPPNAKLFGTRRAAAARALGAERREVLALRGRIKALAATGDSARNVRQRLLAGLSLMAGSLEHHQRALSASPTKAASLLATSQRLRVKSVVPFATAAAIMRNER